MFRRVGFLALLALVVSTIAPAQAPDCTGISVAPGLTGVDYDNQLTALRVEPNFTFSSPLLITSAPGDTERLFVVERGGVIKIIKNGVLVTSPSDFMDIDSLVSGSFSGTDTTERGLLGLAFHPDYQANGYFFVYYTDNSGDGVLARYTRSTPDSANLGSAKTIMNINLSAPSHNGGTLAFGPNDGYLYLGTGDDGGNCDIAENAQDVTSRLGKMLRIDIDVDPAAFLIPPDNPFAGGSSNDDTIWALGLRNPYRYSFDRIGGTLMIGDVGKRDWEEVDCAPGSSTGGENYGWDNYEGNSCPGPTCGPEGSCTITSYSAPVKEYFRDQGDAVIGGYVYRGCRMPDLHGTYFYGNYNWNNFAGDDSEMFISSFRVDASCNISTELSRHADLKNESGWFFQRIAGFGEDQRGEIYFVDQFDGEVFKIAPILPAMEISGAGAGQMFLPTPGDWTWEDLEALSFHPVDTYKVYRSVAGPTGPFDCAFQGPTNVWTGGDTDTPNAGQIYFYVVTGRNAGGEETRAGFRSDGTARSVQTGSTCP